jgi:predicted benzoate:H+ symporter BenE
VARHGVRQVAKLLTSLHLALLSASCLKVLGAFASPWVLDWLAPASALSNLADSGSTLSPELVSVVSSCHLCSQLRFPHEVYWDVAF